MNKKQRNARAKKISRAIDLICDSIISHTDYCHGHVQKIHGKRSFHKKTIREYIEVLDVLASMY